jgi:hypothetical protein
MMKKLLIILIYFYSCDLYAQGDSYKPTIINIQYDKTPDEYYTKFQQYHKFSLEDYTFVAPPTFVKKETPYFTTYYFEIDEPKLLNLGFHTFYIKPQDSISIDYRFKGIDNFQTPDELIQVLTPNGLLVSKNGSPAKSLNNISIDMKSSNTFSTMAKVFEIDYGNNIVKSATQEIYLQNPNYKIQGNKLYDMLFQNYFIIALKSYDRQKDYLSNDEKILMSDKILKLLIVIDHMEIKTTKFYYTLQTIYDLYFRERWKQALYNNNIITNDLIPYDNLTKEYLKLMIFKIDLNNIKDNSSSFISLKNDIKDSTLVSYLNKYLIQKSVGISNKGYISNILRNITIYNTELMKLSFGELFDTSNQPFIYFDFCGSWCVPCILEIEEYKNSNKEIHKSDKIKPIWLFFENDSTKWLNVIEKFNLPKENCFLVLEKKIQNLFFEEYNWQGEFPHHFIFQRDGFIVDKNAPSLNIFKEESLKDINNSKAVPPPPPMLKKKTN